MNDRNSKQTADQQFYKHYLLFILSFTYIEKKYSIISHALKCNIKSSQVSSRIPIMNTYRYDPQPVLFHYYLKHDFNGKSLKLK